MRKPNLSYDDLDYLDCKHFSRIVWWQLGALILMAFFCASLIFMGLVALVNFFMQHPAYFWLTVLWLIAVISLVWLIKFITRK